MPPGSPINDWNVNEHVVQHDSFPWSGPHARRWVLGLVLLLGAWLLSPLAGMVDVEGFSASIDSLALHLTHGTLLDYDRQFPFNLDYFLATRAGVVVALAGLHRLIPDAGDWPFRVVMLLGFVGVLFGSVSLVRRWTGPSVAYPSIALLLMPGVSESSFYYNDNVVSSGLAIVALAVVAARSGRNVAPRAFASGLLLGAAIACRSDALLLVPAWLGVLWMRRAGTRALVAGIGWASLGAAVVVGAFYAAFGITLLDSLAAAHRAVALWSRGLSIKSHVLTLVLFLGVPAGLLAVVGIGALVKGRDRRVAITVLGTLALYNLAYLGKAWEVRSFLPMTPFFAVLVVFGARWVVNRGTRVQRAALAVVLVVVLIAPPLRIATHDGPREVVGRVWAPLLWSAWQRERRADDDGFDRFARSIDASTLVVTANWNADRYLHRALQTAGFTPVSTTGPARCASLVETLARGPIVVRHLRLHVPFVGIYPAYVPLRYDAFVADCGGATAGAAYLASLATLDDEGLADRTTAFSKREVATLRFLPPVVTEPDGVALLDAAALQRVRARWSEEAAASIATSGAVLPASVPPAFRTTDTWFAPSLERLHAH